MAQGTIGERLRLGLRLVLVGAFLYLLVERVVLGGRKLDAPMVLGIGAAALYFLFLFLRRRWRFGAGAVKPEDYHFDLHSGAREEGREERRQ